MYYVTVHNSVDGQAKNNYCPKFQIPRQIKHGTFTPEPLKFQFLPQRFLSLQGIHIFDTGSIPKS
jgi:hypothetical protein